MGHERQARWMGITAILAAALAATMPLLVRGTTCGHDFDFHLVSWLDAHLSWEQGVVYPHWSASANYGAGEPRFVFYPPVTWMLGAALGSVLPWRLVEPALVFLCLAGTGLATRALARERLPEGAAALAGCLALGLGYSPFTAYVRTAFGELAGGFWIALLLLFALRERTPKGSLSQRAFDGSAAPLALALAGACLSNVPLGLMACYLLAAVALAAALIGRTWAPVVRAAVAGVTGLALAGLFLVPAVLEQQWVAPERLQQEDGYRIEQSWLYHLHLPVALAGHANVLRQTSHIVVAMTILALAGIAICWWRGLFKSRPQWWLPLAMIPVAVLLLQLPLSLWVWDTLPKLRLLQFPWRWLVTLEAPMGVLAAAALWTDKPWLRRTAIAGCTLVFAAAVYTTNWKYFQPCDAEDAVWGMLDTWRNGHGFEGADEYGPPTADNSVLAQGLPDACLVGDAGTTLGRVNDDQVLAWTAGEASCAATFARAREATAEHFALETNVPRAGYLVLKLRSYPAWAVRVNGARPANLPQREDGLVAVPVAAGRVRVTADWTTTPDVWAGRGLTALGVLLLTGVCALELRRGRARVS